MRCVVLDALGLHRGDGLAARHELLLRRAPGAGRRGWPRGSRSCRGRRSGMPGSSSSKAASANGDSGWLSAKFGCRSTVRRMHVALGSVDCSHDPGGAQGAVDREGAPGEGELARHGSWLSKTRSRTVREARRRRGAITLSIIEWVICMREVSGLRLGGDEPLEARSRSRTTKPSGAFLRTILRSFLGSSPAFATAGRSRSRGRAPGRPRCRRCRSRPARRGRRSGGTRAR